MPHSKKKGFMQHVHPTLQRRIRIFIVLGAIMLAVVLFDIAQGAMSIPLALVGVAIGAVVGLISSRIFHLSWDHDGQHVVGRIDTVGWVVLAVYIIFEIARATAFQDYIHTGYSAAAITFTFVASALISRVLGLRGRILRILKDEKIFG